MKYELCYLVGESREQEFAKIKEKVSAIVSKEGGKWLEPQIEENRKMAYKIGKEIRGVYVAQQFEIIKDEEKEDEPARNAAHSAAGGEKTNPLDIISKKLNLYNDILRFIIIKAEDVPPLKERKGKPIFAKDSGSERGSYKKPVYYKKTETAVKGKVEAKKEEIMTPEVKEEKSEEKVSEEKTRDTKSIDEKIDEILNI